MATAAATAAMVSAGAAWEHEAEATTIAVAAMMAARVTTAAVAMMAAAVTMAVAAYAATLS